MYVLKGSRELALFEKEILLSATGAIEKIKRKIPISNIDVVFYDDPKATIPEIGIGGRVQNVHTVFISLDPKFKYFRKTIKDEILRTLAHELHHVVRIKKIGYGKTLLEALVSEGLADHFDIEVSGKAPQIWCAALNQKEKNLLKRKAEREYFNRDYNHRDWFLGSEKRNIQMDRIHTRV